MFRNEFGLTLYYQDFDWSLDPEKYPLSVCGIRRYVKDRFELNVTKQAIYKVRDRCGASEIGYGTAKLVPVIKSEKSYAIYEAFKALGMV